MSLTDHLRLDIPSLGTTGPDYATKINEALAKIEGASVYSADAYGAAGDNVTDDYDVLQEVIDQCHSDGGGFVKVSKPSYRTTQTLHWKPFVSLLGVGLYSSKIRSEAAACIQPDGDLGLSNAVAKGLQFIGTDRGFDQAGENITRVYFDHTYFDGGATGQGLRLDGQVIECDWDHSVITPKLVITGTGAKNANRFGMVRVNASGALPASGYVIEIDAESVVQMAFEGLVSEVGGMRVFGVGTILGLALRSCGFYDASVAGVTRALSFEDGGGINFGGVTLENIWAEDFSIVNVATAAKRVRGGDVYCHTFSWGNAPDVHLTGVTTQSAINNVNGVNCHIEHEGTVFGGAHTFDLGFRPNEVRMQGRFLQKAPVTFTDLDTTPSVSGGNVFKADNSGATTITAFDDAVDGQEITIYFTNGNTTIAAGANMYLSGGANFVGTSRDTLTLVRIGTVWAEKARGVNV